MKETDTLTFKIKGLDGVEKTYHLRPLMRKEASRIFHTSLQSVAVAVGQGLDGVSSILSSDKPGEGDLMSAAGSIGAAVNTLNFDSLWDIATSVFKGGMVVSTEPICEEGCTVEFAESGMGKAGEDYFRDHPDELYSAVVKSIDANWPMVFTKARERIAALLAKIAAKKGSKGSNESDGQ